MLGETVFLDCLVSGVPAPRITWSKADGGEMGDSGGGSFRDVRQMIRNFR